MTHVPETPAGLGFSPEQVPSWRPYQYQTIVRMANAEPGSTTIVSAPTGAGKSPIALGVARAWYLENRHKTTILTHQRALQAQYMGYDMVPELRQATGRQNWECIHEDVIPGTTAARAPCTDGVECRLAGIMEPEAAPDCPYFLQRWRAMRAPIRVLNYPYYFLQSKKGMFRSHALVCDEGHRLDKAILEAATVTFTRDALELLAQLRIPFPTTRDGDVIEDPTHPLVDYARFAAGRIESRLATLPRGNAQNRAASRVREIHRQTKELLDGVDWLGSQRVTCVLREHSVIPILSEQLAPRALFGGLESPRRLGLLSATIFDPAYYARRLGLLEDKVDFVEIPSAFPVERRPIYIKPVAKMNVKTTKDPVVLQALVESIDNIIMQYKGRKGLIHCGSYALGREIYERSYYKDRFVVAVPGDNRLQAFTDSADGVYLAPAAYEGLDLKDDLARFNIVAKLSWPNRGDPVTAAQLERVPGFNNHETASALVQAVGRGMRHDMDWCHNYILDGTFNILWAQMQHTLPKWFGEALRR